jgi:hypothetical protein
LFEHLPLMMDAVLATIFEGGQAIHKKQVAIELN